jgi:hypothetical protein
MFFVCCAAETRAEAEVVRPQKVFSEVDGDRAFNLFDNAGKPPLPPPANTPPGTRKNTDRKHSTMTDDSSSASTRMLNADLETDDSRQTTFFKPEKFPRWNPESMPRRQVSFEPGQSVGYQGFSGVMVRQVSPMSEGDQTVLISIPGVGDKEISTHQLVEENHVARRSSRELQFDGMSQAERLNEQVKEFTVQAQKGVRVDFIDPESRLLSEGIIRIDSRMTTMIVQRAHDAEQRLSLKELKTVFKGDNLKRREPKLEHLCEKCLALEFSTLSENLFLFFKDSGERDEFQLCIKVVRSMSGKR